MQKINDGFQAHVALNGLFEVFVIPEEGGTKFLFYPYPDTKANFSEFLVERFGHLGEPADCSLHDDISCHEAHFHGLHFKDPEEALKALLKP